MILTLLLAQAVASPTADVVVVGRRLETELAACIARHCPVAEDAAHSLALARRQFVDGEYARARRTLADAVGRNRRFARTDPLPVAALWREKARVEAHLGEFDAQRASAVELYATQRQGLRADDPERLTGLIEIGDVDFHLGRARSAEGFYREALTLADRTGAKQVAAIARLRLAGTAMARTPGGPTAEDERAARAWLGPVIGAGDPTLAAFDWPARLLLARLAEKRGRAGQVDALLATLPRNARPAPRLVSADPVRLDRLGGMDCADPAARLPDGGTGSGAGCSNPQNRWLTTVVARQWIDIGFTVDAAGRVTDAEVVRQSDRYTGGWADLVLTSVRTRRYAVAPGMTDAAPIIRLERFTLTAPYETNFGTRIRSRAPGLVIESADLLLG